jgi:hypothetical protein
MTVGMFIEMIILLPVLTKLCGITGKDIAGLTLSDPMSDLVRHFDFPVPDAFPNVVWTSANR